MKQASTGRRDFLLQAGASTGLALMGAQWPGILAAAEHAHQAVNAKTPVKFQVLTAAQAKDVEAIAAQIVPSDELPGAREAGVVYFIDQALKTFASDKLPIYEKGIADLNKTVGERYPGVKQFADTSDEQQKALMEEMSNDIKAGGGGRRQTTSEDFFQTVWQHTLFGFLVDPSGGGNRDYAGWKVIGRDPAHSFSPPFGFYDKDYPGWQVPIEAGEKK